MHAAVPGPYSEGHMSKASTWLGQFWHPCGFIGWILSLFLFLWIAQMIRQVTVAGEFFSHVFHMPKVHAEYSSLTTFPGPSQCNHIIRRRGKNDVYAVTSCTRFFVCSVMVGKMFFHVYLGLLGVRILVAADSAADLLFTFLLLWFVNITLPPMLLDTLLPFAVNDVAITRFACLPTPSSVPYQLQGVWKSFLCNACLILIVIISLNGGIVLLWWVPEAPGISGD